MRARLGLACYGVSQTTQATCTLKRGNVALNALLFTVIFLDEFLFNRDGECHIVKVIKPLFHCHSTFIVLSRYVLMNVPLGDASSCVRNALRSHSECVTTMYGFQHSLNIFTLL